MTSDRELVLGIVAGEESGENLAIDLLEAIEAVTGRPAKLVGVGGDRLREKGLNSVFDSSEIAITGVSAVLARLPQLMMRIRQTADALIAARPDAIIMIDSPDFSHRVAKRVKQALPDTPIVKYVAPSVWAWRPERARKMAAHIDHILAILPFEPAVMKRLEGPPTHYVGHPLASDPDLAEVWAERAERPEREAGEPFDLLVLPGSRTGEVNALLPDFGKAVEVLHERGHAFRVHIPTLPRLAETVRRETAAWPVQPSVTVTRDEKLDAFRRADAALAASGTVLLELGLCGVPVISCYRVDLIMRAVVPLITIWTAALPNLICDRPVVPEYFDRTIRPGLLARHVEQFVEPGSLAAQQQIDGFSDMRALLATEERTGTRAARIILDAIAASSR
ncbi:lipid-A-disaccharide synthase [Oricola sp.]|uniref:lipid-A-disaccharide synthase n=1 Tax=Oricola sp. TaxID=1979950 RepID=UPI0025E5A350|nr:lipid-A-disaccharide synthase [Oricola sp.]MCI5076980.1 lipid-A-disaccharide synthase [Oricola sp.]